MKCPYCGGGLVPIKKTDWHHCLSPDCPLAGPVYHEDRHPECYLCHDPIHTGVEEAGVVVAEGEEYFMHENCRLNLQRGHFA